MLRQLRYCVGWMFDPRLWGIDALYRFLRRPSIFERQRRFVNHIALHPSIARKIVRKSSPIGQYERNLAEARRVGVAQVRDAVKAYREAVDSFAQD